MHWCRWHRKYMQPFWADISYRNALFSSEKVPWNPCIYTVIKSIYILDYSQGWIVALSGTFCNIWYTIHYLDSFSIGLFMFGHQTWVLAEVFILTISWFQHLLQLSQADCLNGPHVGTSFLYPQLVEWERIQLCSDLHLLTSALQRCLVKSLFKIC